LASNSTEENETYTKNIKIYEKYETNMKEMKIFSRIVVATGKQIP